MKKGYWLGGYLLLMAYLCTGHYGSGANPGLWNEITNAGHYPAFFVGALVFIWVLRSVCPARISDRYLITMGSLLAIALALFVELIQPYFERSRSVHDALLGSCGALAASGAAWLFYNRRVVPLPRAFIPAYAVFCVYLGAVFALPVWDEFRAIQLRREIFPVLSDFQNSLQVRLWSTNYEDPKGWRASIVRAGKTPTGEPALVVGTVPGRYSGARYSAMDADWSAYQEIVLDILNTNGDFSLAVRIDDRGNSDEYTDRFNRSFLVPHGKQSITIPLREVRSGGGARELDMKKIRFVYLFTTPEQPARVFYILGARLR